MPRRNIRIAAKATTRPLWLHCCQRKKKRKDVAKEGAKIAEEEQKDSGEGDNTPIVASLLPKKKKKRKESTQRWEYVPAIDSASTYWDKGVEGKRQRTIANSSYCDDDARSDSESDPEDLFKPNKEDDASSDSDEAISAKDKVTLPLPHFPHSTAFFPNFASPLSLTITVTIGLLSR